MNILINWINMESSKKNILRKEKQMKDNLY